MNSFYVTTPIYYVNGAPHIGHAYTTIIGDVIAAYHRQLGEQVFYMTGTDEHGLKVQREAEKMGKKPIELADENSKKFRDLFDAFKIQYDRFIRTTEPDHKRVVLELFRRMVERGDIYLSKYEGWYAAADEAFVDEADTEVIDGQRRAKDSKASVEWVAEESYFFRLSKYQEPLLAWYRANPRCIAPEARYNEVVSFVENGLQDLSISRTTFDWGIRLPNDPKHVMYVWLDALTNYISGVGAFSDDPHWQTFWPCSVHLIGKDILRFHAVYWPAFLLSGGIEPPRQIFAHGWWLVEGEKMSKRLGNFIDPSDLIKDYDLDVLRYYLLREVPTGQDGNFVRARLAERNNAELADNLGNLVNRTLRMLERYTGGVVPAVEPAPEDQTLIADAVAARDAYHGHMQALELHRALEAALGLSSALNLYVHQNEPWRLAKDEATHPRLHQVLVCAIEGIRWVATMLLPFMPAKMAAILDALGCTDAASRAFDQLGQWGGLKAGITIVPPDVLFQKIEIAAPVAQETAPTQAKADKKDKNNKPKDKAVTTETHNTNTMTQDVPAAAPAVESNQIEFDDFMKVELRVGLIKTAERVEKSDKLLRLSVDLGEQEPRTIMAGIAKTYAPEELVGRRVAVVANLKPRKIFGTLSHGMLMAADAANGKVELTSFSDAVAPGTRLG
jgi:methionyl-tRNA synthetase